MKKTQALLFDVDGTLLDTKKFILQATEHALSIHGYPVPEQSTIAKLVGKPLPEFYKILTGVEDQSPLQKSHRDFQLANLHLSVPFANTVKTLNVLHNRGYKMAVATSRSKITALEILQQAGLNEFFEIIVSAEDAAEQKPHPAPLLHALEKLNIAPNLAAMIGDSDVDVEAGKNAGTATVRVTYGFHTERLHETAPDFIIDDIGELLNIFL